jgi:hypothetical protein
MAQCAAVLGVAEMFSTWVLFAGAGRVVAVGRA